ncbi:hypothetical protein LPJ78_005017 [Coemansia sp. RSA 989]|nr:hypothetical protein LPJ68_004239 [Coemansia sp. RSA 1086]KAJ1748376.1 hypothetical protein LPJ79_004568 [Coemansia sp. RSA 1821]KAJ1861962.1 hypothetical protein LPJ78_005017 [Coemansia sp. RSA 989]
MGQLYQFLAFYLLCIVVAVYGGPLGSPRLSTRQTLQDLSKLKGGVFVKNGKQTMCGLALIDNKSAMVSADCLEYNGSSVNEDVIYAVYIDNGFDNKTSNHIVTKITVHPNYDPATKANNIAVLEYNDDAWVDWYNYNAIDTYKWKNLVYVQRYVEDVDTGAWGTSKLVRDKYTNDTTCKEISPLYGDNLSDLTCYDKLVAPPSSELSNCNVPYSTVYALLDGIIFQAGIFSYAEISGGSDFCGSGQMRTYYTLVANYLMFARITINRTVYFYEQDVGAYPQTNPYYVMKDSKKRNSDFTMVGGDIYALQNKASASSQESSGQSTSDGSSGDNSDSDGSSGDTSDSDGSSGDNSNSNETSSNGEAKRDGLSKTTTIIIAVCCSVGTLILAALAFFLIRWWRGHISRPRDPMQETNAQHILADDIGGAYVPASVSNHDAASETSDGVKDQSLPPAYADSAVSPVSNLQTHDYSGSAPHSPLVAMPEPYSYEKR